MINNCSSSNLVGLSASLALLVSEEYETDDLIVLAAFLTSLADNIALIADTK